MGVPGTKKRTAKKQQSSSGRVFTLEHANRTLPLVKRIVYDIVKQHKKVCILEDLCYNAPTLGVNPDLDKMRTEYTSDLEALRGLMEELAAIGCELKDFHRGLVDFRAIHKDRLIELSWKLGEENVEHWHEFKGASSTRQKIDSSFFG